MEAGPTVRKVNERCVSNEQIHYFEYLEEQDDEIQSGGRHHTSRY